MEYVVIQASSQQHLRTSSKYVVSEKRQPQKEKNVHLAKQKKVVNPQYRDRKRVKGKKIQRKKMDYCRQIEGSDIQFIILYMLKLCYSCVVFTCLLHCVCCCMPFSLSYFRYVVEVQQQRSGLHRQLERKKRRNIGLKNEIQKNARIYTESIK